MATQKAKQAILITALLGITGLMVVMPKLSMGQANPPATTTQSEELAEAEKLDQQIIQFYEQGKYNEAIPLAERVLAMRKRLLGVEHPLVAQSLNNLAGLYTSQERYLDAEILYLEALKLYKSLLRENPPLFGTILNNFAKLYSIQRRYADAEPFYRQALVIRKRMFKEDHPHVADSLNDLAFLYINQSRYADAEPLYFEALNMRKRLFKEDHPHVASSLNNLAGLYTNQGRYADAEPLYFEALNMRKRLFKKDHPHVASSLNNLAFLYTNQRRYADAEPLYVEALNMRKRLFKEDHPDVASSLNNLAGLYTNQGRYADAEPLYVEALNMRKRLFKGDNSDVADILNNLAFLYTDQGRYADAEPLYVEALNMRKRLFKEDHPDVASSLNNLAGLYTDQVRYADAEPLYVEALNMRKRLFKGDHLAVASSLNNLGLLYFRWRRYADAEHLYLQSLDMSKRLKDHPDMVISLKNLAVFYLSQDKIINALDFLTQGIEIEESNLTYNLSAGFERQKRDYIKTISGTTNATISLHLNSASNNQKAARLAFTTILQRKGRILYILTNNLQILRQRVNDPASLKLIDELSNIYSQLASLIHNPAAQLSSNYSQQVENLEEKAKQKEDELSRRSAEFRLQSQPINVEAIQKLIPSDTALLELVRYQPFNPKAPEKDRFGEPRYAAYILNSSGEPQGIDLGEAKKIETALNSFRQDVRDKYTPVDEQLKKKSARNLDKIVMQPIRKVLGNTRKILLSPDGALNLIPFEALVDENNKYLIENYSFTYLTSGRDLLRLQTSFPSKQPPVIMADPYFERMAKVTTIQGQNRSINLSKKYFPPLPETSEEAKAIGSLLSIGLGIGIEPLIGSQASKGNLQQLKSPQILHIATHGFFESPKQEDKNTFEDNPLLLSGLVLAGFRNQQIGSNENGILTALETTSLNLLGTKLVVLSACDTGIGKDTTGEGVYGLRRALVIAGSESQVISLWKVDDNATKELMVDYYKGVLAKHGRSEALRQTQLKMLRGELGKEYQHPYYWAAFIPSGDWRPMGR